MASATTTNGVLYRSVSVCIRGLDLDKRTATFVASTENPVDTFWGREVLRMSGVDLTRFQGSGPFLDAHDGSTIDNVLGSGQATVVGRELEFSASFDTEGKGARAWGLVQRGHVRTVSIGYRIDPASVRRLKEGETDGQGQAQVRGPALVVNRWELLEVSLVPVPADRDAVLRSALLTQFTTQEGRMPDPAVPTGAPGSVYQQAAGLSTAPTTTASTPAPDAGREEARAAAIRALAPVSLKDMADRLVLEGKTVDEARAALLAALSARSQPLGTPEPKPTTSAPKAVRLADLSDEVLVQSLKRSL